MRDFYGFTGQGISAVDRTFDSVIQIEADGSVTVTFTSDDPHAEAENFRDWQPSYTTTVVFDSPTRVDVRITGSDTTFIFSRKA